MTGEVKAAVSCGWRLKQENKVMETCCQNGIMMFREQQPAKSGVWEVS